MSTPPTDALKAILAEQDKDSAVAWAARALVLLAREVMKHDNSNAALMLAALVLADEADRLFDAHGSESAEIIVEAMARHLVYTKGLSPEDAETDLSLYVAQGVDDCRDVLKKGESR